MGFDLGIFRKDIGLQTSGNNTGGVGDKQLQADYVEWLVEEQWVDMQTRFNLLWEYYTNQMYDVGVSKGSQSGRCYLQAQEYGLPARITGLAHSANAGVFGGKAIKDVQRKEVVIENDIAWRINAAVDFLFGKPVSFVSKSPDSRKRAEVRYSNAEV